ncbi:MAG: hypothetical protein OHK0013_22360 [Sandaracinaceae bacterium]
MLPLVERATVEMATLLVRYPAARGKVVLRGDTPPLDWHKDMPPTTVDGDVSVFRVPVPMGGTVEVKPYRTDGKWCMGRNLVLSPREVVEIAPAFERESGNLLPWHEVPIPGAPSMWIRVMLPPGYDEHSSSVHDVIYALDGQALWSDQHDPFGIWSLDRQLDELWKLGVIDDVIVVSVHTGQDRLGKLGPAPDPVHGGGEAETFLGAISDVLVPLVDATYRTRREADGRGLLGASMGGLFAFYGAWMRPDLFGNAICLSSSFWWADRWLVRAVQASECPTPRPKVYLDSGATASPFAEDANLRDGQHHTRAMMRALIDHCWELEKDLHVLAFPGNLHDASAWGARVSIPLQLFFPNPG